MPLFAEGGGVGVIFEDDGSAELLADGIAQGEVFERFEVIGTEDDPLAQADEPGDADADAEQIEVSIGATESVNRFDHIV